MLNTLIDLFGAQRVALGSDYPFPLGEAKAGQLIESMRLPAKDKKQLLAESAREFLGLA
jgi:aminocarboxymuconate-semialdehyde decarboxylase